MKTFTVDELVKIYTQVDLSDTKTIVRTQKEMNRGYQAINIAKKTLDNYVINGIPEGKKLFKTYRRAVKIITSEKRPTSLTNGVHTMKPFNTAILSLDTALDNLKKAVEAVILTSVEQRLKQERENIRADVERETTERLRDIAKKQNWTDTLRNKLMGA